MAQYVHFGIFLITVPNLIVIGLMIFVFAVAVALSLPQEHTGPLDQTSDQTSDQSANQPLEHAEGNLS